LFPGCASARNRISGDRIIGNGRLPTNNMVTIVLKMAASSLRTSNTFLGAQFRRLRTKLGGPIAIKAMAAKLARLVYRMLRHGMKYVDQAAVFYEAQRRQLQIKYLKSKAAKLEYRPSPGRLKARVSAEFLGSRRPKASQRT